MTSQRFDKAFNALTKAYFEGTLAKGTCTACAVGNIVADAQGGTVTKYFKCTTNNDFWKHLFMTSPIMIFGIPIKHTQSNCISKSFTGDGYASRLKYLTGYSAEELAAVEYAFETRCKIMVQNYPKYSEQRILVDQYKGLAAVVDVLLSFEDVAKEEAAVYKLKLTKHPKLVWTD